ncbi:MAG: right-handed parallel beta-helix repeat-containing protein [Sphingomonas sp.]|nr:right-handed parallel beta-helix repeat-containing protein [Sphingomonas sp.]
MDPTRREFVAGAAAAGLLSSACQASTGDELTPEMFGAKGDGRTNDTAALQALADQVNARGGGTVVLRGVTYIVGSHDQSARSKGGRGSDFAFPPGRILQFADCRSPVIVRGNGAKLRAAAGLRFGYFDPATGRPFEGGTGAAERGYRASPYFGMIEALNCTALVEITDVELDGNLDALEIGGRWGKGRQISGSGILLAGNSGPERLSRIYSHHHPLDGMKITGPNERATSSTISDVSCEYNARQGCSLTGGRNYHFLRCRFRHTGKGRIKSQPKAGFDIEPGRERIARNLSFRDCEFANNDGFGMAAGGGDSLGSTFDACTFIGTTNWSAWPNKPGIRFNKCNFVGAITRGFGDPDPARAAQFHDCSFRDDPALSPTRQVYGDPDWNQSIAVLRRSANVLFNRCDFALTHQGTLPWSKADVIFADCRMSQRSSAQSRPLGTYRGTTIITGSADLAGSRILGDVILNGAKLPRTTA